NNSHISLRTELKIEEIEEQNELKKTAEKQQEKATETETVSQKAVKDEEPREDPEEESESFKEFHSRESSGDTKSLTFDSSCISQAPQKLSHSQEELPLQEGCGDTDDLSCPSSFLSCSSYERLRQSICKRDRRTSTLNVRSPVDLDFEQDLETTFADIKLRHSSSTSIVMKGRSLSLTPNSRDRAIGFESNNNCWPYFRHSDIDGALSAFKRVDEDKNGYISLCELKRFLEILEMPQTHLKAKKIMAQVVGGSEERLNFSEALLIFGSVKHRLVPLRWRLHQREKGQFVINDRVDVAQVGVTGAKLFFEAKIALQT
ncbi:hypothetical protein KR059_004228, partial [Drosophila kikkawai]